MRTLLVVYLMSEAIKFDRSDALVVYGVFSSGVFFSSIIGGIVGDLAIGHKKATIYGAILQAIGACCFFVPQIPIIYIGLSLLAFGSGLYNPNMLATFGKEYATKHRYLDAGFSILDFVVNLAAFLGILVISYIGENYGYQYGFLIAACLSLLAILPIIFVKGINASVENKNNNILDEHILPGIRIAEKTILKPKPIYILLAILVSGIFWTIKNQFDARSYQLAYEFEALNISFIGTPLSYSINYTIYIPIIIFLIILWTHVYSSQLFKLMLGFLFGALAFIVFLNIPLQVNESHLLYFIILLFLINLAEIHISPVAQSVIIQYGNPKYLAILFSLIYLPGGLFGYVVPFIMLNQDPDRDISLYVAVTILLIVTLILVCVYVSYRRRVSKMKMVKDRQSQ